MKIRLNNEYLTGEQVTKLIEIHNSNVRRFKTLNDYYDNKNEITTRHKSSDKPNNKLSHSFAKYITDMATSYFMGKGVRFFIENEEFDNLFKAVLDEEYEKDNIYELAKESSIKGISYELLYINEKSELKSKQLTSEDVIPIFSNKVGEFLAGAIRLYTITDYFNNADTIHYAEYYSKNEIVTYQKVSNNGFYSEVSRERHNLSDVPFILYLNNKELKGDFENVISLIDAYDKAQSDTANDFEYFTDAYLVLIGADEGFFTDDENEIDKNKVKTFKDEKILLLAENGQASWLIKNINDIAVENYKNRLYQNMFFLSFVPSLTDEAFSGNLSGVAIAYKLIGLENLATTKENKFRASIKKKLKIITDFINLKYNKNFSYNEITIKLDRNVIKNLTEIIDYITKLEDIISKETILEQLPFIKDVKKEMKRITEEETEHEKISNSNKVDYGDVYDDK